METINLNVPTVHCHSCQLTIAESLDELDGVATSHVDLDDKKVTVIYDPAVVDPNAITRTIEEAGYPVNG